MAVQTKLCQFTREQYYQLLSTGMYHELYPEGTGNYESDVKLSHENGFKIEQDEQIL